MRFLNDPASIQQLTCQWQGPRLVDGRPAVPATVLERMARVTTEEIWAFLRQHAHHNQFEGNWLNTNVTRPFAGRAMTVCMLPDRPDLHALVDVEGAQAGHGGGQNSWPIDSLQPGDVLVVDLFGKVVDGTFIGDNLAATMQARGAAGAVIDGGIRDLQGVRQMPDLTVLCRGVDPSAIKDAVLGGVNVPVRIGRATVLPGDVALATATGVIFVPAHLAEGAVDHAEDTQFRDRFGKLRIGEGVYTAGDIDRQWEGHIEADYQEWLRTPRMSQGTEPTREETDHAN